jgi:hypothetical protein
MTPSGLFDPDVFFYRIDPGGTPTPWLPIPNNQIGDGWGGPGGKCRQVSLDVRKEGESAVSGPVPARASFLLVNGGALLVRSGGTFTLEFSLIR